MSNTNSNETTTTTTTTSEKRSDEQEIETDNNNKNKETLITTNDSDVPKTTLELNLDPNLRFSTGLFQSSTTATARNTGKDANRSKNQGLVEEEEEDDDED